MGLCWIIVELFDGATLCAQEFKWRELEEQRKAERLQRQLQQEQAYLLSLQHGPKQRTSSLTAQPDWPKLPQARPLDGPEPPGCSNTDESSPNAELPCQTDRDHSVNPDAEQNKHVDGNEDLTDECREQTESVSVDSNPLVTQSVGETDRTDEPLVHSTPTSDPVSEAQPIGEVKSSSHWSSHCCLLPLWLLELTSAQFCMWSTFNLMAVGYKCAGGSSRNLVFFRFWYFQSIIQHHNWLLLLSSPLLFIHFISVFLILRVQIVFIHTFAMELSHLFSTDIGTALNCCLKHCRHESFSQKGKELLIRNPYRYKLCLLNWSLSTNLVF